MSVAPINTTAISVAEYSARIVRSLRAVGGGVVEGEVQRPKTTPGGMLVFDLTDGTAKLACKVFRTQVARLQHHPRHGDRVQVRIDRPDLWAQAGKLDVIVADISLAGEGELLRRREELLRQLTAEGLCDHSRRRALPTFPRAVGVIAGQGSDGLSDVIAALQARFPPVHIVTCTATVQGVRAPRAIIDALVRLDKHPLVDVIVIARGGGSVQDLVAFDDEGLCRAVFACSTPVIAAIGHTDNIPVCNHVAWASETPSRSPELAVPSAASLRQDLKIAAARLAPVPQRVGTRLNAIETVTLHPGDRVRSRELAIARAVATIRDAERGFFETRQSALADARATLAGVRGRIPDAADIHALAGRLDARAVEFFAQRADAVRVLADRGREVSAALDGLAAAVREGADVAVTVRESLHARARDLRESTVDAADVRVALESQIRAVALAATPALAVTASLDARLDATDEQGARLAAGTRKELNDHLRDYTRALARLAAERRDVVLRRLSAETEKTKAILEGLAAASHRRVGHDRRELHHLVAVLAASDPRRRGWVLPTTRDGAVVRSVHALTRGDHLNLSFHDGAAGAVIDTVPDEEQT